MPLHVTENNNELVKDMVGLTPGQSAAPLSLVQPIETPTNLTKLALTGILPGQEVLVTGEANRIEKYIGGDIDDDANWAYQPSVYSDTVIWGDIVTLPTTSSGQSRVSTELDFPSNFFADGQAYKLAIDLLGEGGTDAPSGGMNFVGYYDVGDPLFGIEHFTIHFQDGNVYIGNRRFTYDRNASYMYNHAFHYDQPQTLKFYINGPWNNPSDQKYEVKLIRIKGVS